jgi:hypothetical protein
MAGFNINSFKQNVSDYGYLYSNAFEVYIATPQAIFNSLVGSGNTPVPTQRIAQNLKFRIDQVRAPGLSLMTTDINRYGLGATQKMPINSQFQEVSFSMMLDEYGEIWQYWYQWLRAINDASGTEQRLPTYKVEYKDQYSTVMQVVMYDHYGNPVNKINLFEAFPTSIREIPLAWGDNQVVKLNISIAYTNYTLEGSEIQPQPRPASTGPSSFERNRSVNIAP